MGSLKYQRMLVAFDERLAFRDNRPILHHFLDVLGPHGRGIGFVKGFLEGSFTLDKYLRLAKVTDMSKDLRKLMNGLNYKPVALRASEIEDEAPLLQLPGEVLELVAAWLPQRDRITFVRHTCWHLRNALEGRCFFACNLSKFETMGTHQWQIVKSVISSFKLSSCVIERPLLDHVSDVLIQPSLTSCQLYAATQAQLNMMCRATKLHTYIVSCHVDADVLHVPSSVKALIYTGGEALLDGVKPNLTCMRLCCVEWDAAVACIQAAPNLRSLGVGSSMEMNKILQRMKGLKCLRELRITDSLWHTELHDDTMAALRKHKALRSLFLQRYSLTEESMNVLTSLPLEELRFQTVVTYSFAGIAAMKSLTTLSLQHLTLSGGVLILVIRALPKLVELDVHASFGLSTDNFVGEIAHVIGTDCKTILRVVMATYENTKFLYERSAHWKDVRAERRHFDVFADLDFKYSEWPAAAVTWH